MHTNMKKAPYATKYYNNINPNNKQNSDYIVNKEEKYYYQKRTTKIKSYSIQQQEVTEYPAKSNYISDDNINRNYLIGANKNNNIPRNKYNLLNNKNNIVFMNNKNYDNPKLYNNNIDLIRKKKELEEQRERERKIMEWFYINDIDLSKRDLYDAMATVIQSVFRGWLFRTRISNGFHHTYSFNEINNYINKGCNHLDKMYSQNIDKKLKLFFYKLKNYKNYNNNEQPNKSNDEKEKEKLYEEIKELIKQNNKLQKELSDILTENKNLKNETERYKEYKTKYKEIFDQIEKLYDLNNKYIEENQLLKNRLNDLIVNKDDNKINDKCIIEKLNLSNI